MKKRIAFLLAAAMLITSLAGCGGNNSSADAPAADGGNTTPAADNIPDTAPAEEPVVLRIGHSQGETGDWHLALLEFKKDLEERTNGGITVEIYPNETLGNELDNITGVQQGLCEGVLSGEALSNWTDAAALVSVPYAANSIEDLINIAGSDEVGGVIEQKIEEGAHLHAIGFLARSARNLTSNREIRSFDDVKGLKIRVPNNNLSVALWNAFGASATPMAWTEVFTSLQNGTLEAQENPYSSILSNNIQEVQKYLIKTEHTYSWIYVLLGEEVWNALSADQQAAVEASAQVMMDFQQQFLKDDIANQEAQLAEQMTVIEIDKTPFIEAAKEVLKDQLSAENYELYLKMVDMNQ